MPAPHTDARAVPSALPSAAATLVLMLALPTALAWASGSVWRYFAIGAASWVGAVALKLALMRIAGVRRWVATGILTAAAWGLVSAVAELGFTAALVAGRLEGAAFVDVVAIGVGVASVEILYVLGAGVREHWRGQDPDTVEAWIAGARRSGWVRHMLFVERLSATLGHVGTRGLICIALATHTAWPALLALASFSVVDGVAIYGRSRKWNWCDPALARRFYLMALAVGLLECGLFVVLWWG